MPNSLKIVIPMAGFGSRLRPLTWSKPKPLVSLAGKTVLDHVLAMFHTVPNIEQAEFVFILGPTQGDPIRSFMAEHYPQLSVHYAIQPEMKGQSDAFWQARAYLQGPMLMDFSDTLLAHDFSFLAEETADAVALVKPVPDPRRFGVAETESSGRVTRLIEKPQELHNNLALVGCYYFRQSERLIEAIETQIERRIALEDEFYLADAINIMLDGGLNMRAEVVETWLDAGTTDALLETNRYLLSHGGDNSSAVAADDQCVIIPPVSIDPTARITRSVIGPHVSVGPQVQISGSLISNTIIGAEAQITDSQLTASLLGHRALVEGQTGRFYLGDDSQAVR